MSGIPLGGPGSAGMNPLVRGMSPTRQEGTRIGECACCGVATMDFVIFDLGPAPLPGRPLRRRTVLICVDDTQRYKDWVLAEIEAGNGDDGSGTVLMHHMLRRYLKLRRPSLVIPED